MAVAFCDVDLVESLKTGVRYLWPLMPDGGVLFTHEAHHLEVAKFFHCDAWWEKELGQKAPGVDWVWLRIGTRASQNTARILWELSRFGAEESCDYEGF